MGASQSHSHKRKVGSGTGSENNVVKRNKSLKRQNKTREDAGYFLVKFKKTQIKIVNADTIELNTIANIIRYIVYIYTFSSAN